MTADVRYRTSRRVAACAAAVLSVAFFLPSTSWGAPVTVTTPEYTATIPVTPTDWKPGQPGSLADPVSIPKFDSSLGTLLSVNFALKYTLQNTASMTFTSPSTITVGTQNTSITVDRPDNSSIIAAFPADYTNSYTSAFATTKSFPAQTSTGSASALSLNSATDLALFSGKAGDMIGLPVIANAHSTFSSSTGNGSGGVTTDAGAQVIVTYTYAVPEPGTVAVLGFGLVAALVVRRKRA